MYATCYLLLSICYLLSESFYLKIAITCKNLFPFAPVVRLVIFSKVTEHFVVKWLLHFISDKIDFRQYGGLKGNSITHYIIKFINFILLCQDSSEQTAILACMVDFSKAFNRRNHYLLITKLSDMGVPGWLLKIVVAFLKDRKMVVKHKGGHSNFKKLPGGSPQGTIFALLLFIQCDHL